MENEHLTPVDLVLKRTRWNKTELCKFLGIRKSTLSRWIKNGGRIPHTKQNLILEINNINNKITAEEIILGGRL